jgi:hypothetical protein
MLYYSISLFHLFIHTYSYVKLRLNWTLKNECQFHVKSLFLFLFSWVWDSSDQTKGSSSLTYMTGTTYIYIYINTIYELNLKVNENLSYINAKSKRTLLYNIDKMTFKQLELHTLVRWWNEFYFSLTLILMIIFFIERTKERWW